MFRVGWRSTALQDLTAEWLAADATGRRSLSATSAFIDQSLASDPGSFGESRAGDSDRVWFVGDYLVRFTVSLGLGLVEVTEFRRVA